MAKKSIGNVYRSVHRRRVEREEEEEEEKKKQRKQKAAMEFYFRYFK